AQASHAAGKPCIAAANEGLRPSTPFRERAFGDSAQIRFATPSPRSSLARILDLDQSLPSRAASVGRKIETLAPLRRAVVARFSRVTAEIVTLELEIAARPADPGLHFFAGDLLAENRFWSPMPDERHDFGPEVAM